MTVPFTLPGYDAWRLRGPDEGPDYSGLTIEREDSDALDWIVPVLIYDGDGDLIGARLGTLELSLDELRKALGDEGYSRFTTLDSAALDDARADYMTDKWEDRYGRDD